jgi:hypothetical protein
MRIMACLLATVLMAETAWSAPQETVRADWAKFTGAVASQGLKDRAVRVTLKGGKTIKTRLFDAGPEGITVALSRATRQWKAAGGDALIPKDQVARVRFGGRVKSHGLLGAAIGGGAGAAIGAGIAASKTPSEGVGIVIVPLVAVGLAVGGALAGYFIGRRAGQEAPEFILQ